MADRFEDCASGGQFGFELGFADASEPEAITKEVLGLILGGDNDLEAVVFHVVVGVGGGLLVPRGDKEKLAKRGET